MNNKSKSGWTRCFVTVSLLLFLYSFCNSAFAISLGFSGMAYMGNNQYLVVMDTKNHKPGARLGVLNVIKNNALHFEPINIDDWRHADGAASDLESACKIPGTENQYLVAESGDWKGKFGRIFRIEITQHSANIKANVKATYSLPIYQSNNETTEGSNFEGMLCVVKDHNLHILMGERGGSALYPDGFLNQGLLDLQQDKLTWLSLNEFKFETNSRSLLSAAMPARSISDLHIDEKNIIWASATQDEGDMGPFNSVIYALGELYFEGEQLKIKENQHKPSFIDGLKIEALAKQPDIFPQARLSYGSEDEDLGGVWRLLSH